jgi:hypothetical protein
MTGVVSETEKAGYTRQVSTGKTNVSEPLMKYRKGIDVTRPLVIDGHGHSAVPRVTGATCVVRAIPPHGAGQAHLHPPTQPVVQVTA